MIIDFLFSFQKSLLEKLDAIIEEEDWNYDKKNAFIDIRIINEPKVDLCTKCLSVGDICFTKEDTEKFEYLLKLANDIFNYPINKFMIHNNRFCSHCYDLFNLLKKVFEKMNLSKEPGLDTNVSEINNFETFVEKEEKVMLKIDTSRNNLNKQKKKNEIPCPKQQTRGIKASKKPFICEVCQHSYTNASGLSRHKKDRHISNGKIHCTFSGCSKIFRDSTSQKTHFASKHKSEVSKILSEVPKIMCKVCKTMFGTNHQLYIHKGKCKNISG